MEPRESDDRARGHFETSARALLGVGSLGIIIGASCIASGMSPPMIDAEGFVITGCIIAIVGLMMSTVGSKADS